MNPGDPGARDHAPPRPTLDDLRAELDAADRELIAAAARRLRAVREIGRYKAASASGTFDRERERGVLDRAATLARAEGLPPALGERLVGLLIEHGHGEQERLVAAVASPPRAILLVGGRGRMGRFFAARLAGAGHRVLPWEPGDPTALADAVRDAEIVVNCAPMAISASVARELCGLLRSDQLIADINSLKAEICAVYREHAPGEALGLHPMFGPTTPSLRRQKVVVCPVKPGPLGDALTAELARQGAEIVQATPEDHDRAMAVVQVLVHFRTLVMGLALRRSGANLAETLRFTSPIYRLELAVTGRLFAQDPALYADIELQNPHGEEVRDTFREAARELAELLSAGDRAAFIERFASVRAWFGDFGGDAMRLSDTLIAAMVDRA